MWHHRANSSLLAQAVSGTALIDARHVGKTYRTPSGSFVALEDITFQVQPGDFVAIVGKSGSGKSTLVNLITGIDRSTTGEVFVASAALHTLTESQLAVWRGRKVGVVFQFFQLLPTLTILENVLLPMDFCKTYPGRERRARAMRLLERMGIPDQAHKLPATLSGGQQQRAAIARALANDPPILVADEPTGNLDSHTTDVILRLFADLAGEGKAVVMVTHERDVQDVVTRVITLGDGRIISERITSVRPLARDLAEALRA